MVESFEEGEFPALGEEADRQADQPVIRPGNDPDGHFPPLQLAEDGPADDFRLHAAALVLLDLGEVLLPMVGAVGFPPGVPC